MHVGCVIGFVCELLEFVFFCEDLELRVYFIAGCVRKLVSFGG